MRTSFHHQPEAQHPNFQLSTSWQADYPIFWHEADMLEPSSRCPLSERSGHPKASGARRSDENDPKRTSRGLKSRSAAVCRLTEMCYPFGRSADRSLRRRRSPSGDDRRAAETLSASTEYKEPRTVRG